MFNFGPPLEIAGLQPEWATAPRWPEVIVLTSSFDLQWCERNAIAFTKRLVRCRRLTIDTDQVTVGVKRADMSLEHLLNGGSSGHVNVMGESARVVADEQDFHELP